MPATHLLMSGFKERVSPHLRFSETPRLTIQQAFNEASQFLPSGSSILFHKWGGMISIDIYPFATPEQATADTGPEPSHFAYKFYPAHKSVLISRIKAEKQKSGIGSAMIASQYNFLQKMGIETISVSTHALGEGFYRKLGFRDIPRLLEKPQEDPSYSLFLQLDLNDPVQKSTFEKALNKARPLVAPV